MVNEKVCSTTIDLLLIDKRIGWSPYKELLLHIDKESLERVFMERISLAHNEYVMTSHCDPSPIDEILKLISPKGDRSEEFERIEFDLDLNPDKITIMDAPHIKESKRQGVITQRTAMINDSLEETATSLKEMSGCDDSITVSCLLDTYEIVVPDTYPSIMRILREIKTTERSVAVEERISIPLAMIKAVRFVPASV